MALRWLSRVRSTSFLRRQQPPSAGALDVSRTEQFDQIVSDCSRFFSENGVDADGFEQIARSALEDPVLQAKAKQSVAAFATASKTGLQISLPGEIDVDLRIALLREGVVALVEASIPLKIGDRLSQALADPSPSQCVHQVRAVIDSLPGETRRCVQKWVRAFVLLQSSRKYRDLLHYPLLCQFCAFVLLSQIYHRSKFIALRKLSDQKNGPLDLGLILIQSCSFLFTEDDAQEMRPKPEYDAPLQNEIAQLKSVLESVRIQNESLAGENQQLKHEVQQASSRKKALSGLVSNLGARPYQVVWRQIKTGIRRPSPRYKHTSSFDRSRASLIIYAGLNEDNQLGDVWRLRVELCIWDRPAVCGRTPPGRHSHAAAIAGDRLVVFGGFVGRFVTNETLVLDIAIWTWSQPRIVGTCPCARHGASMAALDDTSVLLFGGRDKVQFFHDLWKFSTETLCWTPLTVDGDYPLPRSMPLFGEIHKDLWIVAGGQNPDHINEAILAEFTRPDKVVWRRISRTSDDRACLNLGVVLANEPFLIVEKSPNFGEVLQPGLSSFKMALSRLVISSSSWEDVQSESECPGIRSGATISAVSESKAVLFGGYCDSRIFDELWFLEISLRNSDPLKSADLI